MKIKTYIIATILSLLALGAALVFSNVSNAQLSGGSGTINQLEQWRSLGGYLFPRDSTLGLKVPGLATSTTGCLSVASDGIITANGSACGSGSGSGFSTTSANYWKDYVSTLPGLVSFGSSTATTTALGNLTAIGYVQLGTTTTAMLNGVIVVDGVHYPQTGAGIQNAIDVANSRGLKECVFVPSGTYTNATSTIIYSNTCIRGAKDGSTILLGTGNVPTIRTYKNGTSKTTYTNILIEDITIKASYNGLGAHITRLNNIDGLTVRNSRFEHTTTPLSGTPESLYVEHAQNVTLTGNTVFNTAGNGIQVNGVDYFTISNNTISSTTDDAIDVDYDFIDTDTVPSRYGTVVGNVIYNVSGGNGIRVENSEKITVTGNQISDVRAAGAGGVIVNSTTASVPVSDVVVSGNQIYGVYGNGIYVSGSYTTNTLIASNNIASTSLNAGSDVRAGINIASASTTVTGNTINGVSKSNGDSGGIVIYRVNDVNVANNHISNSSKGINLWNEGFTNDYTGIVAKDNTFDNVTTPYYGASSSWYKPGVFLSGVVFDSTRSNPKTGYGTTTPGAFFSIGGSLLADILAISSTTASSSFANGINLTSGCFAIGGVCVGGSGVSGGTANMLAAFTSATAVTATGTPAVTAINATSSTATSTFAGGLKLSSLNCSGFSNSGKLTVNASGEVICLADTSGSGSSIDWTFLNNYGSANTNITPTSTMPLWARGAFYASSTAVIQGSSYFIGNVGIGASSPSSLLTVLGGDIVLREDDNGNDAAKLSAGNSSGQLSLLKDGVVTVFFDAFGTNPNYIAGGNVGIGTTSPYAKLSVAGPVVAEKYTATGTATSSFGWDINLPTGHCYQVNGTCIGTGAALSGGTANMLAAWTSSSALTATGTPAVTAINATSSLATSTFAGSATISNYLIISTTSLPTTSNGPFGLGKGQGNFITSCDACGASGGNLLTIANYGSGSAGVNTFDARGSQAAPSATQSGDTLYFMGGRGFGSTVWNTGSKVAVQMKANQAFTDTANGTYITLETTPNNSTTRAERMRIDNNGSVGIGTTSPYAALSIVGSTGVVAEKYTATGTAATSTFAGGLKLSSLNCSGLSNGGALTVNASGEVVCTADDSGAGGTNYWATAGSDVFINTGTSASAPMFNATSTTGTSTFAGGLTVETSGLVYDYSTNNLGVGTAAPAVNLHLYQAATAPYLRIQGASDGDNVGALELWNSAATKKWQFAHQATGNFTFAHYNGGWASPFTIEDDNDILIGSNSLNFNAGGTSGSNYKFAQDSDDLMTLQRSGGTDTNYSLLQIKAPAANPTEATIALMTDAGSGNYRFADFYNQQYPTERQWGLRQRYSGTYAATPFMIDFYNGTVKDPMLAIMPSGNVGIGVSTSTLGSSGAAFLVGSTTAPAVFNGNVGIGTTTPGAYLHALGITEQLRLGYDSNNYASFTVGSTGTLTINSIGSNTITTADNMRMTGGISSASTDTNANFRVTGSQGISGALSTGALQLPGAASVNVRVYFRGSTNDTLTVDNNYAALNVANMAVTEAASGNHPILAQLAVQPMSVTAGSATVDNTATVYIEDAASTTVVGTGNYALWVDDGVSRFDGNVGIASSTPSYLLSVGSVSITDGIQVGIRDANGVCTLDPDSGGSWSCTSDARLKDNIKDTEQSGLDYVSNFRVRDFTMKADGSAHTGVIAQELLATNPELVSKADDGFYTVMQPNGWLLAKAIQELDEKTGGVPAQAKDNWQWAAIALLALAVMFQQVQINRIKKVG